MKKIIYTGAFRFPDGDAAAARVLGIGKALRRAGYEIKYAGWEEKERDQDIHDDGRYICQGFDYKSQKDLRNNELSLIGRLLHYLFMGKNTIRWLKKEDVGNVCAIIAYHGTSIFLIRLAIFCKVHRIKLIIDCTEWYASDHLVGGRYGLVSLDNEVRMRIINKKIGHIISISSFLEKYYKANGCDVLRIPALVDLSEEKWLNAKKESKIQKNRVIRLVYAGKPSKKDLLGNILRGLIILKDDGLEFEFHLIGPSIIDVLECLHGEKAVLDKLGDSIVFHGRIQQSKVPSIIASCDYSVLLRPVERYAQAGFSTKLVESLTAGVPVITNITGDIAKYVYDGVEGIILSDYSALAVADGVRKAILLTETKRQEMRINARLKAEASFDFRKYVKQLDEFVLNKK